MNQKRASAYLLLTLFLLLTLTFQPAFSEETIPEFLLLTIYPDGFVAVGCTLIVDPTFPSQNVTVFGQILQDLIVVDAEGLLLSYSLNGYTLSIYSLGTDEITVTYLTQEITQKEGRYWTLTLNAPTNTRILLPVEAVIINLNKVPEMIETNGDRMNLLMKSGYIEVTYVIGIVGTQEHAQIVLDEAEKIITEIKKINIILTEAEIKLKQAENAFTLGNYAETETLGNEARNLAIQINQTAAQAQSQITKAQEAISNAQYEERTLGLNEAQNLLDQAQIAYDLGDYSEASNLATQALKEAEETDILLSEEYKTFLLYGVVAVFIVPTSVGFVFFVVKLRKKPEADTKRKRQIDTDRIFREHKDLMPEEKQAIHFLVENHGEAFEAELYDCVKLPRTTTWRLVKRLKRMGILTVTKFRRQNFVRLKNKYDIKD